MRKLIPFAAAAVFAGLVAYPSSSQALKYRRSHADECQNEATNVTDGIVNPNYWLRCPFMDNDNFTHAEVTSLAVYLYHTDDINCGLQPYSRTCVTFSQAGGGACDSEYTTYDTGFVSINPPTDTVWVDYPSEFAWLYIKTQCDGDIVKGYKAEDS